MTTRPVHLRNASNWCSLAAAVAYMVSRIVARCVTAAVPQPMNGACVLIDGQECRLWECQTVYSNNRPS